jgi:uncharacterized protein involved in exopolysaccharide biosynthesis
MPDVFLWLIAGFSLGIMLSIVAVALLIVWLAHRWRG